LEWGVAYYHFSLKVVWICNRDAFNVIILKDKEEQVVVNDIFLLDFLFFNLRIKHINNVSS
jgi:hypothetical protein